MDTRGAIHVERHNFLVPQGVGLLVVASFNPCLNRKLVEIQVLEAEGKRCLYPVCWEADLLHDALVSLRRLETSLK